MIDKSYITALFKFRRALCSGKANQASPFNVLFAASSFYLRPGQRQLARLDYTCSEHKIVETDPPHSLLGEPQLVP